MGAKVVRMMRNFNLENRAFREISKLKPRAAPRHESTKPKAPLVGVSDVTLDSIQQKNDPLLGHLKSVYVESTDPTTTSSTAGAAAAAEPSKEESLCKAPDLRSLRVTLPEGPYDLAEPTDVPKGKLTITEALKVLGSYQRQPQTWTPEKIAQEYSLDLKDTKALLEFFIPFRIEIIRPDDKGTKRINAS